MKNDMNIFINTFTFLDIEEACTDPGCTDCDQVKAPSSKKRKLDDKTGGKSRNPPRKTFKLEATTRRKKRDERIWSIVKEIEDDLDELNALHATLTASLRKKE
jgi:hypothetical protein